MSHAFALGPLVAAPTRRKVVAMIGVATLVHCIIIAQAVAQGTVDPISGGAGWAGAGLLIGVLGWVFYVLLPSKDKQNAALVESFNASLREIVDRNDVASRTQTERFAATIAEITTKHAETEREQRHEYRDMRHTDILRYEQEREFSANAIRANLDEQRALMGDVRRVMADVRRVLEELQRVIGPPPPAPHRPTRGNVSDPDAKKG